MPTSTSVTLRNWLICWTGYRFRRITTRRFGPSAISTVAGLTRILNEVGDRLAATGGTTT